MPYTWVGLIGCVVPSVGPPVGPPETHPVGWVDKKARGAMTIFAWESMSLQFVAAKAASTCPNNHIESGDRSGFRGKERNMDATS